MEHLSEHIREHWLPVESHSNPEFSPPRPAQCYLFVVRDWYFDDAGVEAGVQFDLNPLEQLAERQTVLGLVDEESPFVELVVVFHFLGDVAYDQFGDQVGGLPFPLGDGERVLLDEELPEFGLCFQVSLLEASPAEGTAVVLLGDGGLVETVEAEDVAAVVDGDGSVVEFEADGAEVVLVDRLLDL